MSKKQEEKDSRVNAERFEMLALLHGYNELAKLSSTLGERVYYRLFCQQIEKELAAKYDVKITHTEERGPTLLTLGHKPPYITFSARDIEAMRQTVAAYDAEQATK